MSYYKAPKKESKSMTVTYTGFLNMGKTFAPKTKINKVNYVIKFKK
jgi:hypothetical protein